MCKPVLCTRCGYFMYEYENTEKCPVCKKKLISPVDQETYYKMSRLEMDAFLFKIQPPEAYDPDWWDERRRHDAEYIYSSYHNSELLEKERQEKEDNGGFFIGFNIPL